MKGDTTIIYAVALLRTIASAISGFAIEVFVRFSGASDIEASLISSVPSVTYMLAALFLSGQVDKLGRRVALLISSGFSFLASVIYIAVFVGITNLSALVYSVILIGAVEGVFAGWFWPVLQARLGDGNKEGGHEIRMYNLSWNLGIILGNAMVVSYSGVSVSPAILFPIVLQVLAWTIAINGVIFSILWAKFGVSNAAPVIQEFATTLPKMEPALGDPRKSKVTVPVSVSVALMALFTFAFNIGGVLTNVFNQVTTVSETAIVAVNLLPWIPIIDTTRQMTQLAASGTYKVAKPALNDITRIISIMSVLALLAGGASSILASGGIIILLLMLSIHGILSGILYNATMQIILKDAPANQRGRYQGLYEAVLGLGFFIGPIVAGTISQFNGYVASYSALAGVSLIATWALAGAEVRVEQEKYLRVGLNAFAQVSRFPGVVSRVSFAVAILWLSTRNFGLLGSVVSLGGIVLGFVSVRIAMRIFLKPRSDHMQAFDRFISPRQRAITVCMPVPENRYCALAPQAREVILLVPC